MPFKLLLIPGHGVDILTESALFTRIAILHPEKFLVDVVPPEEATEFSLMRRMAVDGNQYDGLHFLGHATDAGFRLPDGSLIDQDHIHRLCIDGGARFVFLNACTTGRIAQYLVNRKVAVAIANATEVLDRVAIMNAARFYSALAESQAPFAGGLRAAYDAAAPDDGSFLWLTNGQYTREIIDPIIARMDRFDEERRTRFEEFGNKLDLMLSQQEQTNANITATFAQIREWIARQLADFTTSHKRLTLLVKLLILAVALLTIFFVAGSIMAQAQTVPLPTATLLPGCGPSGGQPSKCNTPTPYPTVTETLQPTSPPETPGATEAPTMTEYTTPTPASTLTPVLLPTKEATATETPTIFRPTATVTIAPTWTTEHPTVTETLQPTSPPETPGATEAPTMTEYTTPTPASTLTPVLLPTKEATATETPTIFRPTATVTIAPTWTTEHGTDSPKPTTAPTATLSDFDQAVARAVKATLTALGCD